MTHTDNEQPTADLQGDTTSQERPEETVDLHGDATSQERPEETVALQPESEPQPQQEAEPTPAPAQEALDVVSSSESLAAPVDDDEVGAQLALKNLERRRAEKRRKKRIRIIAVAGAAAALVAVVLGWRALSSAGDEPEAQPQTAVVERMDFENVISGSGALKAGSTVMVTPEVDGIIQSVAVSEGQRVNTGDLLFTLKNDSLDKAVRDAAQEVQTAQQGVNSAQQAVGLANQARDDAWNRYYQQFAEADAKHMEWENLRNNYATLHAEWENAMYAAEVNYSVKAEPVAPTPLTTDSPELQARYNEQYAKYLSDLEIYNAYKQEIERIGAEPQPAGVEPTYPEAPEDASLVSAIQSAQDAVTTANNTLTKASEAYDEAVKQAEKRTVKAPASGNVVAVGAKVGESVGGAAGGTTSSTSSRTSLVQISDVNSMTVDIEVNEIDILSVQKGQPAKVTFSAVPDLECDAVVSEVATIASGSSGEGGAGAGGGGGIVTYHVSLVIPRPDAKLREGMTANVKISTQSANNVLVVPTAAVFDGAAGPTVQVVTDPETMTTETRPVKVSMKNSNQTVVDEGLQEGDTLLVGDADSEA